MEQALSSLRGDGFSDRFVVPIGLGFRNGFGGEGTNAVFCFVSATDGVGKTAGAGEAAETSGLGILGDGSSFRDRYSLRSRCGLRDGRSLRRQ